MAGTMKGFSPKPRKEATVAATNSGREAMPRDPTQTATRIPGRRPAGNSRAVKARRTSAPGSATAAASKRCVTRYILRDIFILRCAAWRRGSGQSQHAVPAAAQVFFQRFRSRGQVSGRDQTTQLPVIFHHERQ